MTITTRPKLAPEKRRTVQVSCYVAPELASAVDAAAAAAGTTDSCIIERAIALALRRKRPVPQAHTGRVKMHGYITAAMADELRSMAAAHGRSVAASVAAAVAAYVAS